MERGRITKERILDTAQTLVLDKGFAATSIDDIITATGVTKGAFFHHFRSKGDLAHRLVERFAANDFALFDEWDRRAEALSEFRSVVGVAARAAQLPTEPDKKVRRLMESRAAARRRSFYFRV